ncbi:ATP-dependent DNA ligase [Streptomyces atratus]|uniref:ATP-dependent DNA ligase n=1 Tax=Streptomyces atratus TaxID=1893 RepID=UPI0036643536
MDPPLDVALAKAVDTLPTSPGLAYEPKYDGHRATIERTESTAVLRSKTGRVITSAWMDLAVGAMRLRPGVILDGEIVIYRNGRLDFSAVQQRAASGHARGYALAKHLPATFVAFDLVQHPEQGDVRARPYRVRRALMLEEVSGDPPIQPTPMTTDPDEARVWWEALREQGIEGLVIKSLDGPYPSGRYGWRKLRHADTVDCPVVGYVGNSARPTHLVVELPDGRVALSRRLSAPVRFHAAPALVVSDPGVAAWTSGGEAYTTCDRGLLVEVLAGTTRHATVTVTRVRE